MNIFRNTKQNPAAWAGTFRVVGCAVLVVCLGVMAAETAQAQQIPRRLDTLQLIRPIAPTPVPPVERLRQDIIRAIDPKTGTIDASQIVGPIPRGRPWLNPDSGSAGTASQIVGPIPRGRPGLYPDVGSTVSSSQLPGPIPKGRKPR
jgi:hypothetical protein